MASTPNKLNADRLFEATEAVLAATHELAAAGSLASLVEMLEQPHKLPRLAAFAPDELREGLLFLVRLGYVRLTHHP